jgi:hypothetical protein
VGDYYWEQEPLLPNLKNREQTNLNLLPNLKNREQTNLNLLPNLENREQTKNLLPNPEIREQTKNLLPNPEIREQEPDNLAVGTHITIKGVTYILTGSKKFKTEYKPLYVSNGWFDIKLDKRKRNMYLCWRYREGHRQRSTHIGKVIIADL